MQNKSIIIIGMATYHKSTDMRTTEKIPTIIVDIIMLNFCFFERLEKENIFSFFRSPVIFLYKLLLSSSSFPFKLNKIE